MSSIEIVVHASSVSIYAYSASGKILHGAARNSVLNAYRRTGYYDFVMSCYYTLRLDIADDQRALILIGNLLNTPGPFGSEVAWISTSGNVAFGSYPRGNHYGLFEDQPFGDVRFLKVWLK